MEPFPFKEMDRGQHVQVAGRQIWVAQVGDGPALLLLHGGGAGRDGCIEFHPQHSRAGQAFPIDRAGFARLRAVDKGDRSGRSLW
jgi:hypothetical protein